MYVVSKYVKKPKLSLMDIFLNRTNYEAVTFNRTYEYNHLPKELGCEESIAQYKNMLRVWFNKYGDLMNKINTKEYDYELQVELQSKLKKDIKNNGFNGSKENLDLLVKEEVEKELNNRGLKYCELYNTFFIPKKKKKNGHIKWRRIDAPTPMFKQALKELSDIFDKLMEGRSNHTAAYAYVKGRSIKDAEEKHQKHGSRWYLKLDLKDFFGSTTPKFVYDMFSQIYPFCEIVKNPEGDSLLKKCLSLCFLDGKLPQGTPISPIITNIMMIPIDHKIQNGLTYKYNAVDKYGTRRKLVYTRYADDMVISCRTDFKSIKKDGVKYSPVQDEEGNAIDVEKWINKVFEKFNAPFKINSDKTRYTSINGSNWHLGLLINQDLEISLGHNARDILSATLWNFANRILRNEEVPVLEAQQILGRLNYHYNIEKDKTTNIVRKLSIKSNVDIPNALKYCIKRN